MDGSSPGHTDQPGPLDGRQAIVTGAASASGRAVVAALVRDGAMVIATDASDEAVEGAIAAIGLADADEVITRGLDETSLGSWWDLANLVDAYFHALDLLVHVPAGDVADSLPHAIARLGRALENTEREGRGRATVVVVADEAPAKVIAIGRPLAGLGTGVGLEVVPAEPIPGCVARVIDCATPDAAPHAAGESGGAPPALSHPSREETRHA